RTAAFLAAGGAAGPPAAWASVPHPVVLGLAPDAAGRLGPCLETSLRHAVTAVDAGAVAAVLQAGERVHDQAALLPGRLEDGLGAVGLGEAGAGVRRIPRIARGSIVSVILPLQDRDGPVQVVA